MAHALVLVGGSEQTLDACAEAGLAVRTQTTAEEAPIAGKVVVVELAGAEHVAAITAMGPVWVVAIVDDAAEGVRALAAGADEVVVRPVRPMDLLLRTEPRRDLRRIARSVAHELNNLLSVIGGCARFVDAELDVDDPLRTDVAHALRAAENAEALARRLQALGRREPREASEVDVAELLSSMQSVLRRSVGAHVLLRMEHVPAPRVRVDREAIEQIILELAIQLHHLMPEGGTAVFGSAPRSVAGELAERHAIAPGEYVGLWVAAAELPRVAFVAAEIGRVGGCALVEADKLWLLLPPYQGVPQVDAPATILVVDDDPVIRNAVVRRVLEKAGFTVLAAAGPAEAVELAERYEGEIEVLLTDVLMPGMNGMQLARCIEQLRGSIAVVYMTGHAAMVHALGDAPVLHKPIDPHALVATLHAALDGRTSR